MRDTISGPKSHLPNAETRKKIHGFFFYRAEIKRYGKLVLIAPLFPRPEGLLSKFGNEGFW